MTQYLFSVVHDYENMPPVSDPAADAEGMRRVGDFNNSIRDQIVFMGGLHAPDSAITCKVTNGEAIATDGPYTETKEIIGGLWVIEAATREEAMELGKRATEACGVTVEVRPFHSI